MATATTWPPTTVQPAKWPPPPPTHPIPETNPHTCPIPPKSTTRRHRRRRRPPIPPRPRHRMPHATRRYSHHLKCSLPSRAISSNSRRRLTFFFFVVWFGGCGGGGAGAGEAEDDNQGDAGEVREVEPRAPDGGHVLGDRAGARVRGWVGAWVRARGHRLRRRRLRRRVQRRRHARRRRRRLAAARPHQEPVPQRYIATLLLFAHM